MAKISITFQQYVEKHARASGEAATAELAKLKKKFPDYKNAKMFEKNFPVVHGRYVAFTKRGSQSKKSA